jgi:hypothetical protein
VIGVKGMNPLDGLAHFLRSAKLVVNSDPADDENASIQLDFSHRFRGQLAIRGVNLARFQRALEGSGKSARRCRDDIIERRCARWIGVRRDLVVLRYFRMHAKNNRRRLSGQICQPHRTTLPLDTNSRSINNFA